MTLKKHGVILHKMGSWTCFKRVLRETPGICLVKHAGVQGAWLKQNTLPGRQAIFAFPQNITLSFRHLVWHLPKKRKDKRLINNLETHM